MAVANLQRLSSQVHRLPSLSFFSKSLISRSTATTTTAITSSSTKKVSDRIVRFSAIDFEGKKHEVVGLAGHTLLKALINTGLIDPDSHRLEEIDACSAHCEVNIAQEWLDKLPLAPTTRNTSSFGIPEPGSSTSTPGSDARSSSTTTSKVWSLPSPNLGPGTLPKPPSPTSPPFVFSVLFNNVRTEHNRSR
ncbi:hypothetical protein ACSQ67_024657 [Phaseolus vulgaris]